MKEKEEIEMSKDDGVLLKFMMNLITDAVKQGIVDGVKQVEENAALKEKMTYDIKLKNTRLLLKNYRKFVKFCERATVSEEELETATVEEILDKIYCSAYDEVTIVQGILSSKKRTEIIMTHIKKIINFYIFDANDSKNDEKCRRANILNDLYIKEKKQPPMSVLAKRYHISERQVHRDKNVAIEEVAVMMFGIDGIRKM